MRIGSLFSGAGGLDMAVQSVFGGEVIWQSEIDKAASQVLAYRFPCTPNLGDITRIDWKTVETPDVLCAGWPCQPFSVAGHQRGVEDERALWPFVADAVRSLRPTIVVLENVPAIIVHGELARAVGDLQSCGYDTQWMCLRASDAGAPHSRERIFIVAHPTGIRPQQDDEFTWGYAQKITVTDRDRLSLSQWDIWDRYSEAVTTWESITQPAPPPKEVFNGRWQLNPGFAEWMMGWPFGWVTDPDIGISRNDQLKIIGNGVVPQQASAAIRHLLSVAATV